MEWRPLSGQELQDLRALVDDAVRTTLAAPNRLGWVRGGLYAVEWEVGGLDAGRLERVAWLLSRTGFGLRDLEQRTAPSAVPGVVDVFHVLRATRSCVFLPDSLYGEALVIESVAAQWEAHLQGLQLPGDNGSFHTAYASLHGPIGQDIA